MRGRPMNERCELIHDIIHCVTSDIARRWDHNCVTTTDDEPIRARRRCDVTRPFHQWEVGSFLLLRSMACFLFCCNAIGLPKRRARLYFTQFASHVPERPINLRSSLITGVKISDGFTSYERRESARRKEIKKYRMLDMVTRGNPRTQDPRGAFCCSSRKKRKNKEKRGKGGEQGTCLVMSASDGKSKRSEKKKRKKTPHAFIFLDKSRSLYLWTHFFSVSRLMCNIRYSFTFWI